MSFEDILTYKKFYKCGYVWILIKRGVNMKRTILILIIAILLLQSVVAYVGSSVSENSLTGDSDDQLAYEYGYNRGYTDGLQGKKTPLTAQDYFGRPGLPGTFTIAETQMAYYHKGEYRVGYNDGHADAISGKTKLYSVDVPNEVTTPAVSVVTITGTYVDPNEIDLSKGVASFAYEQGYADALAGKGSNPYLIFSTLGKSRTADGRALLQEIQTDGNYISSYKKGYAAFTSVEPELEFELITTRDPSQLSYSDRDEVVEQLGYDYGFRHAELGLSKNPMGMFRYGPSSPPSATGYFSVTSTPAFDVELAHLEKGRFTIGYRRGFDAVD